MMDPVDVQKEQIIEVAKVHDHNGKCVGLPFCVSCRAVALLHCDLNPLMAELFMSKQPEGTVLKLRGKA